MAERKKVSFLFLTSVLATLASFLLFKHKAASFHLGTFMLAVSHWTPQTSTPLIPSLPLGLHADSACHRGLGPGQLTTASTHPGPTPRFLFSLTCLALSDLQYTFHYFFFVFLSAQSNRTGRIFVTFITALPPVVLQHCLANIRHLKYIWNEWTALWMLGADTTREIFRYHRGCGRLEVKQDGCGKMRLEKQAGAGLCMVGKPC